MLDDNSSRSKSHEWTDNSYTFVIHFLVVRRKQAGENDKIIGCIKKP